ncbi:MAG: hypothetical protein ABFD64_01145 [Armatimonadota bacterium]
MKVAPVKKYIDPKYPTSRILEEHPELLKLVPKRWQGNAVVLTALASACILSACLQKGSAAKQVSRTDLEFRHSEKRAVFLGGRVMTPPVFLSEDEARAVIVDEAKRASITFKADGQKLSKSSVPELKPFLPLVFDGYDKKHKISYEVVSMSDFKNWNKKIQPAIQSSYGTKEMAKRLKGALVKVKSGGYYAVFYSPGESREAAKKHYGYKQPAYDAKDVDWQAENAKILEMTKDLARKDLRKQVKDFISWLKAEGVI